MPFNKPPTVSLRATERPKTRPRSRRAETDSPPKRSNTRKVNIVSQASLAMLNPAYAMGIEAGPSWQEEKEARWRAERARKVQQADTHPYRSNFNAASPIMKAEPRSPWCMSPTPELEAFLIDEPLEHQLGQQNVDGEGDALGLTLHASDMARKQSSESVFEDDEPSPLKRRPNASSNSSSSTLSRFFTWKRSPRGKNAPLPISPSWDIPQSAPPQIQYFDRPSLETPSKVGASSVNASPSTPVDVFPRPLPSTGSLSKVLTRSMSRKSSMPTLRDIRRAAANSSNHDIPLAEVKPVDAASSFYWRSNDEPKTPTMASSGTLTPSSSNNSSISGRLTPQSGSSSHRISSLGRGLASPRKSTVDVPMTTDYSPDPSPIKMAPKKKGQQLHLTRNDPWSLHNMPPLPTNISIASLVATEEEEERRLKEETNSSTCSSGSSTATVAPRRRSRSVGAVLTDSIPSLSLTSSAEAGDEGEMTTQQVTRVHLNNRSIVGTASPKLLFRETPCAVGRSHSNALLKVMEPPVVVNVMPPTPDLGASEQETFETSSMMSPGGREGEEARCEKEEELSSLVEGHCIIASSSSEDIDRKNCAGRSSMYNEVEDDSCSLQRSDSVRSDMSQSTVASAESNFTNNVDEPFGFARSMSTMSLASDSSCETDSTCSRDAEEEDEEDRDCKGAQIMSARSTISSFSKAHFVSPRIRELSGWSNGFHGGDNSISSSPSNKSFVSLNSSADTPPSSKRKSKRLSSIAGQSLANVVTEGMSKSDTPAYRNGKDDLSSPVELQTPVDETDCDTPRLSGTSTMATTSTTMTTRPLNVKKATMEKQESPKPTTILSPPRLFPRAHNAESPHLELDLSLPLDLHDIGPIVEPRESSLNRERPRVPQKSRARVTTMIPNHTMTTGEPKTPPSTTRLLASVMHEGKHRESFGLGLGLGLGLEDAMNSQFVKEKNSSPPRAQLWQRPRRALVAHRHAPNTLSPSHIGFAI